MKAKELELRMQKCANESPEPSNLAASKYESDMKPVAPQKRDNLNLPAQGTNEG